jgi:hypothetical protein
MGLERELTTLACVKAGTRPPYSPETVCRIYSDLRRTGLIEKKGRSHRLTKRGALILAAME